MIGRFAANMPDKSRQSGETRAHETKLNFGIASRMVRIDDSHKSGD